MSHQCRFCYNDLNHTFIDLGISPLSNSYLTQSDLSKQEIFYPLHVLVCPRCLLVQLPQYAPPEHIFNDYAYFSSYSDTWLQHAFAYTQMVIQRFAINTQWQVVEIASNDGYLLQYFKQYNIPALGIEPAQNVAKIAQEKGIDTLAIFFGKMTAEKLSQEGIQANLLIANNVLAHVPHLNDFVSGIKVLLAPRGIATIEFPHLLCLMKYNQFDTIYHEHFSYFSLYTVLQVFAKHGLTIFDVEELPVHGGSLRIFIKHSEDSTKEITHNIQTILNKEKAFGLHDLNAYQSFANNIRKIKLGLLDFIIQENKMGSKIVGYGAPAKGNTLLNYCNISNDLLSFTVDKNPYKQNRYLPGTHIPIWHPDKIREVKPDYVLILPWNLQEEIVKQMSYIKEWGAKFIVPIPRLEII